MRVSRSQRPCPTHLSTMNPVSNFYIMSPRGDTIVSKEFRGDIAKGAAEVFFRKVSAVELQRAEPACAARRRGGCRRRSLLRWRAAEEHA